MVPGLLAGIALFLGVNLQQLGISFEETTAGKAGFITGLYVIFVPLIGVFVGQRARPPTWIGAALAVIGLYLLSVSDELTISRGDFYVFLCAIVWAVHVLIVGHFSPRCDGLRLAIVQFALSGVVACILAVIMEKPTWPAIWAGLPAILYCAVFVVAIAFTLQVVAQRDAPAAHAAVILSGEAVFAALIGWLYLGETLAGRELAGCGLMLLGMLVAQYHPRPARAANFP